MRSQHEPTHPLNPAQAGWRPVPWGRTIGISRSQVYNLIAEGAIDSVKLRTSRIITTSPQDFLRSLATKAA